MNNFSKENLFVIIYLIFIPVVITVATNIENLKARIATLNDNKKRSCSKKATGPICGVDSVIHPNICLMTRSAVKFPREWSYCDCSEPAGFDEECNEKKYPVCGSDGKTYKNRCFLLRASCRNNGTIFETDNRPPSCKVKDCPVLATNPVCTCRFNKNCADFHLSQNQRKSYLRLFANPCLAGKNKVKVDNLLNCFCDTTDKKCPHKKEEVCGNDKHLYKNRCELIYFACSNFQLMIHEVPIECCKSLNTTSNKCL